MSHDDHLDKIDATRAKIELEQLAFRQLTDGRLSPEEFQALEDQLLTDHAFRERYLEFVRLEAVMADSLTAVPAPPEQVILPDVKKAAGKRGWWALCGILATSSLAVALLARSPAPVILPPEQVAPVIVEAPRTPVATRSDLMALTLQHMPDAAVVTQADADAQANSSPALQIGKRLKPGGLAITKGRVQLDFLNGAQLVIEAPAELLILSSDAATLLSGSVAARVPEVARGFVLNGPNSAVIDLGTEFTMSVDEKNISEVHVVDGEVEVSLLGDDGNTLQSDRLSQAGTVRLSKGMARMEELPSPSYPLPSVGKHPAPTLHVSEEYVRRVINDGARLYWRFEDAAQNFLKNEAGAEFQGRIVPENSAEFGVEVQNGQLNFSASTSPRYVEASCLLNGLNEDSYSFEIWVNPEGFHHGGFLSIFPKDDPFALRHLVLLEVAHKTSMVHVPGAFRFLHRFPPRERGGLNLFSKEGSVPGQWHHIVATKNREQLRLYMNGVVVRQLETMKVSDSQPYQLILGQLRNSNPERQFIGSVDELAIYWRDLSEEEVKDHYDIMQKGGEQ